MGSLGKGRFPPLQGVGRVGAPLRGRMDVFSGAGSYLLKASDAIFDLAWSFVQHGTKLDCRIFVNEPQNLCYGDRCPMFLECLCFFENVPFCRLFHCGFGVGEKGIRLRSVGRRTWKVRSLSLPRTPLPNVASPIGSCTPATRIFCKGGV